MTLVFPAMTPRQQADAVVRTETAENERDRRPGDRVALISAPWFAAWCAHTGCTYDAAQRRLLPPSDDAPDASGPEPGPLSSEGLLDIAAAAGDLSPGEFSAAAPLRPGLKEKDDFWVLHEATYNLLKNWYGENGAPVVRHYLPVGARRQLELNVDHWHLKAVDEHTGAEAVVPAVRHATVAALKEACCSALDLDADEVELADYSGRTVAPKGLEDARIKTLLGAGLKDRQAVLLRRKDHPESAAAAAAASKRFALSHPTSSAPIATPGPVAAGALADAAATAVPMSVEGTALPPLLPAPGGTGGSAGSSGAAAAGLTSFALGASVGSLSPSRQFAPLGAAGTPLSDSPLSRSFGRAPLGAEDVCHPASGRRPGLAGLGNLGNTCFMNSSLQCLVHSVPLMRAFLTGAYREDLNKDNPLGLGGKLAVAFGGLMGKLWRGSVASVAPKHFKWRLARFAPQFSGYAQQDSQELLAFLLDGLHEDLNRILIKPYREEKDADGRPDADVAAEAWENYRARNDSVVVDHFQGLLKSTLRCPECDRRSVKFDPFMYLSLPLPTAKTTTLTLTVVDVAGAAAPLKIAVEVLKDGTVGDAVAAVAACVEGASGAADAGTAKDRWLLAKWNPTAYTGDAKLELCADLGAAVAVLEPPAARSRYFLSSSPKHTLVAYRYPDVSSGPGSGARPTVVFHRADGKLAGVPAVFFFPSGASGTAEDAAGEALRFAKFQTGGGGFGFFSGGATRWALTPPSPVHSALEAFLRPFLKEGVDAAALMLPPSPQEGDGAGSPMGSVAGAAAGAAGAPTPASASVGMDVDARDEGLGANVAFGSAVQLEAASEDDDMPTLLPAAATTAAADAAAPPALDENFNMLDASTEETMPPVDSLPDLLDAAAAAAVEGGDAPAAEEQAPKEAVDVAHEPAKPVPAAPPAVQLLLAQKSANPVAASALDTAPNLSSFSATPPPIFLVAEWDKTAASALDLSPWTAPAQHESAAAAAAAAAAPPRPVSLDDCVDAFTQPERLDASDSWYCTGCKGHVRAEKKLDLWRLPEILVVHLKRFSYSRSYRDKLDTPVDFPLEGFDLRHVVPAAEGGTLGSGDASTASVDGSAAAPPAPVYDLYAVSNHYGGMGGGHYTAYCRMPDTGQWHSFDDSSVTGMDPGEVRSPAAYVLFYRRRDADESDVSKIVEVAARQAAEAEDDDVVDSMGVGLGGIGGSGSGAVVPVLEQVAEEGEEEGEGDENVGPGAAAAEAAAEEERGPAAHALFKLDEDEDDTMAVDDI